MVVVLGRERLDTNANMGCCGEKKDHEGWHGHGPGPVGVYFAPAINPEAPDGEGGSEVSHSTKGVAMSR